MLKKHGWLLAYFGAVIGAILHMFLMFSSDPLTALDGKVGLFGCVILMYVIPKPKES